MKDVRTVATAPRIGGRVVIGRGASYNTFTLAGPIDSVGEYRVMRLQDLGLVEYGRPNFNGEKEFGVAGIELTELGEKVRTLYRDGSYDSATDIMDDAEESVRYLPQSPDEPNRVSFNHSTARDIFTRWLKTIGEDWSMDNGEVLVHV